VDDEGRRGDDVHVHDGVDARALDDPPDHRVADVGAHELDVADVLRGRDDVDADHPVDRGVSAQPAGEQAAEVPGHPGDEDHRSHAPLLTSDVPEPNPTQCPREP